MKRNFFQLTNLRIEVSFKSLQELRSILSFYQQNNIYKINIPCKGDLKKDFLLDAIKTSREEFPDIDLIPHFSILHEFKRNRVNTLNSLIQFLQTAKQLGCNNVLLVSGSQKRSTLDTVSSLEFLKNNTLLFNRDFSIGVAFNPYLPIDLFEDELIKLEKKVKSGLVTSIWIQFGTDSNLLEQRVKILKKITDSAENSKSRKFKIKLFGSVLVPSKQFISRFKYRPWKGVYCSDKFLESVKEAENLVIKLVKTYKNFKITPIIETDVCSEKKLKSLVNLLK